MIEHRYYIACSCDENILHTTGEHFLRCAYGVLHRYCRELSKKGIDPCDKSRKFVRQLSRDKKYFTVQNMGFHTMIDIMQKLHDVHLSGALKTGLNVTGRTSRSTGNKHIKFPIKINIKYNINYRMCIRDNAKTPKSKLIG